MITVINESRGHGVRFASESLKKISDLRVNHWFSAPAKTLVLILEL